MCSPTQPDPIVNPHQSPCPSLSAHEHIYYPLISPVSDTFIHKYHKSVIENKGKFTHYFPSLSHSLPTPLSISILATPPLSMASVPMTLPALWHTPGTPCSYASLHMPSV